MRSDARHRQSRRRGFGPAALFAGLILAATVLLSAANPAEAETRSLKLYFVHTKERAEIPYKRNGKYLQSGLTKINHLLRDWRRNEPTKMNPLLLDLIWEVYRQTGSNDYIHVISAYRAPETNAMLRKRSNGVAKKSQHMLGNALDFYIPGVKLSTLRNIGLKMQVGGVGYYPRSGSPFVHLDIGGVRHWPRMSRSELASVFPNGKTLHVPSDGKPLPGYEQALAAYKARSRNGGTIQIASDDGERTRGRGLLAALFGGGADEEEDNAEVQVAATSRPAAPAQQPQRQQAQPQPQPEAPATILAALPARALPVPRAAPRPDVNVGTPLPVEPSQAALAQAEEAEPQTAEVQTALNVPIPTRRPEYEPPAPAVQLAEAGEEGSVPLPATAFVTPTHRPEQTRSADVIAQLLTAQKDAEEIMPASAPAPVDPSEDRYVVAALQGKDELSDAPGEEVAAASAPLGSRVDASPRLALLKNHGGMPPAAILSGGAKTTGKGARPGPQDARPEPKPMVLPVNLASAGLALSRESILNRTLHTGKPGFSAEIAKAPKAVYTAGFEQGEIVADARRLTGKAVTFLSVAKFE